MKFPALAILLLLQSGLVLAQGYKCELPNGKIAFQDHPCQAGAVRTTLELQSQPLPQGAPASAAPALAAPSANVDFAAEHQRLEAELVARNAVAAAQGQAQRCEHARANLDALKLERRVYRADAKGERHYIDDDARPAEVASIERFVATNCK